MSFDRSTQSKSWIFSEGDLSLCRTKATSERLDFRKQNEAARVRKFASGFRFHANTSRQRHQSALQKDNILPPSLSLSPLDQDVLVRFHAHQISMLIGPDAILPCLVRSDDVYATAIMIFRRFYLSNSVLDFSPRRMATAACFLASKLEENRIEVSFIQFQIKPAISQNLLYFFPNDIGWLVCYLNVDFFILTRSFNYIHMYNVIP